MVDRKALVVPRTLKGFRDLLPAEALQQSRMLAALRAVFESFGYAPIETPHLEYTDILIGETAGEIGKQLYRFQDQGGRDVCLRFDLTVPFARYVVQHRQELGVPFKRYAIGSAFRGENTQQGRFREFIQCDFDLVGVSTVSADAEVLQVIAAALLALGVDDFTIRVNSRRLMNALCESQGVAERATEIIRILDKLEKVGVVEVRRLLAEEVGLSVASLDFILDFIALSAEGSAAEVLARVAPKRALNENLAAALDELQELNRLLAEVESLKGRWCLDFRIARGFGYYTGIVYETILNPLPELGSVCSGGRYDNLTQNFSREPLPGVGAAVGLSRLLAGLQQLGLTATAVTPAELLLLQLDRESTPQVYRLAEQLRAAGLKVEVYPEVVKLKRQFQYAERKGYSKVVLAGPEELAVGAVAVKDLKSGEQVTFSSWEEALAALR